MVRILIADDHDVVRSGLCHLLARQSNWEVVAEASNGRDAVAKAVETRPNVAIVDYSLPMLNGLEVTRQIRERVSQTEILLFTMHESDVLLQEALKAGARGYLLKADITDHIFLAIRSVAHHKPYFSMNISAIKPAGGPIGQAKSILTNRERTVVRLIAEGQSNKMMANMLDISPKTVETHRAAVMRKLSISSSASLVRYAIRNGIIEA